MTSAYLAVFFAKFDQKITVAKAVDHFMPQDTISTSTWTFGSRKACRTPPIDTAGSRAFSSVTFFVFAREVGDDVVGPSGQS